MSKEVNFQEIISPTDEYQRTENLRLLYSRLQESPDFLLDTRIKKYLANFITQDFTQAALVGLILLHFHATKKRDVSLYARVFPILYLDYEQELKQAAIEAMPEVSPGQLYDKIAEIALHGNPKSVAFHYAFWVLSKVDADSLKNDFKEYT